MLPYFAWLTGALFFFYAWVLRVAPSVMIDELMPVSYTHLTLPTIYSV